VFGVVGGEGVLCVVRWVGGVMVNGKRWQRRSALLRTDASIASLRGQVHRIEVAGRRVSGGGDLPPAYLLRQPPGQGESWADLCFAREVHARE